jgi:hypothetical protein
MINIQGNQKMEVAPEIFRERLAGLIKKFERDKYYYLSKAYSEAQAQIDFIDPLFEILGWDVRNVKNLPPHDREVLVEIPNSVTSRK